MISATLLTPASTTTPGDTAITIELEFEEAPAAEDLDTILLYINGVGVSRDIDWADTLITVSSSVFLVGDQNVIISVSHEIGGTSSTHFNVVTSPESSLRGNDYLYSPYTEQLASYFPEYSRAASDRTSVFQQLVNPIALRFDSIKQRVQRHARGFLPNAASSWDPDWLCQYQLKTSQNFNVTIGADGSESVVPPDVFGQEGVNSIRLAPANSFGEFWDEALPTRWRPPIEIQSQEELTPCVALRDVEELAPFKVPTKGRVHCHISNATKLVDVTLVPLGQTVLVLKGVNPTGRKQTEEITIYENGSTSSRLPWGEIQSVSLETNIDDVAGDVVFSAFPVRLCPKVDATFKRVIERQPDSLKWEWIQDDLGTCLDKKASSEGHLVDIARGDDSSTVLERFRLADVDGNLVAVEDCTMNQTGTFFFGIAESTLFIWDRRDRLPGNLGLLAGGTESPELQFAIVAYSPQTVEDDAPSVTVSVEMERPANSKTIRAWMWSVVKPNGDTVYIKSSTGEIFEYEYWNENPAPILYFGIKQSDFEVTLTEVGDYIFQLQYVCTDGTEEVVRKVYQMHQKNAIAQYELAHLIEFEDEVSRIHMTEDDRLLISNAGIIYRMTPAFDTFLIDVDERKLYFREKFDTVEVQFNE